MSQWCAQVVVLYNTYDLPLGPGLVIKGRITLDRNHWTICGSDVGLFLLLLFFSVFLTSEGPDAPTARVKLLLVTLSVYCLPPFDPQSPHALQSSNIGVICHLILTSDGLQRPSDAQCTAQLVVL